MLFEVQPFNTLVMLVDVFSKDSTLIFKSPSAWNFIFTKLRNLLDKHDGVEPEKDFDIIRNNIIVFMINKLLLQFLKYNEDNEEERGFTAALQT